MTSIAAYLEVARSELVIFFIFVWHPGDIGLAGKSYQHPLHAAYVVLQARTATDEQSKSS
jgi:hypothetical protein